VSTEPATWEVDGAVPAEEPTTAADLTIVLMPDSYRRARARRRIKWARAMRRWGRPSRHAS
jgi:hypothetical protein